MSDSLSERETVRITISIPTTLTHRAQPFIGRDALIVTALERFLDELERQEIGRQFEAMANDTAYQTFNEQLVEEFSDSDWEALQDGERQ